ncbi:MAG: hypothetical protein NTV87_05860 [Ignavibacteriae bacterium]|nr:hypothetical protein [Ignavibacteriota bacterium]
MDILVNSNLLSDLFSQPVISDAMVVDYADLCDIPNNSAEVVKLNILKKIVDRIDKNMKVFIALHGYDFDDSYHGVKIEKAMTPMTFSLDEDAEYLMLKTKLDDRAKLLKQQAKLFENQMIQGKNSDDFTGLVIEGEQIPVVTFNPGKETIKLTFPKK